MPRAKHASKKKRPSKALSMLGIAGVSLAASTAGSPADMPGASLAVPAAGSVAETLWRNAAPFQIPSLYEEEIADVSLATFSLFDNEDPRNSQSGHPTCCFPWRRLRLRTRLRRQRLQRLRLWLPRLRRLRLGLGRLRRLRRDLGLGRRLLLVVGRLLPLVLDRSALRLR
jgi:hypothetical protein